MAGWGEDTTEIKTGSPASLTIGSDGKVRRINFRIARLTRRLYL